MSAPLTLVSLPLFPLHTVLFPGGKLSLRVFEPRYRTMIRCCREQGSPFGVVTLLSGHEVRQSNQPLETFHTVGTLAHLESVTPMGNGLELVHCVGRERFRITSTRRLHVGLWVADVDMLSTDLPIPIPADLVHSAQALQQVVHKLPAEQQARFGAPQFDDCGWVANRWCELFPLAEALQMQLLVMDSPLLRLELITDALERSGIVPRPHHET